MKTHRWVCVGFGLVAIVAVGFAVHAELGRRAVAVKAQRFDAYCHFVRTAIDIDIGDFSNPKLQERAADRFGEPITGHSYMEITMCAGKEPDFSRKDECWIRNDFACLQEIAKATLASIPRQD